MMILFYSFSGLAMGMVDPMVFTIIGEHYPLEKRGFAIGWVVAGAGLAGIICPPLVGILANISSWRLSFLGFVLPLAFSGTEKTHFKVYLCLRATSG